MGYKETDGGSTVSSQGLEGGEERNRREVSLYVVQLSIRNDSADTSITRA